MADIVITEVMDAGVAEALARDYDVLFDPTLHANPSHLRVAVQSARALIVRNQTQVTAELLEAGPDLLCIGRLGVGLDNIDLDACASRDVQVFPATGANTDSVAELVLGALFCLFRGAYHASEAVLAGEWPRTQLMGREVQGHRLGLVGFGAIARAVAKRAGALGMTLAAHDPAVSPDDPAWAELGVQCQELPTLLAESDALSVHVPLLETTRHMIDATAIADMKEGAVLLNAARGGIVEETALVAALVSGKLAGAYLDVFEIEPVEAGSIFEGVPNLILTPHVGAMTAEGDKRVSEMTAASVRWTLEAAPQVG